jgi:hypothetical protein
MARQGMFSLLIDMLIAIIDESIATHKGFIILHPNSRNNLNKCVLQISHGKYEIN